MVLQQIHTYSGGICMYLVYTLKELLWLQEISKDCDTTENDMETLITSISMMNSFVSLATMNAVCCQHVFCCQSIWFFLKTVSVEEKEVSEMLVLFAKLTYPKTFLVLEDKSFKHYFRLFFMFDGVFVYNWEI
ncbi:hypothetical protein GAYE_SCF63G6627 [Galdieria yellowstonensis]|uniref:Uncharacterized protein n=1 Tax=Galdieria yellowstonensis TaxID=3028027 RepID=A0AAV9IMK9_9RHOD|nr:hypothetical protein GAYE_SCF63G6627 [Galdieria yellowstonensis]